MTYFRISCLFLLVGLFSSCSNSETANYYIVDGVAVSGYDVVSYFTNSKPEKGSESISVTYNQNNYYFSSEEHKELFLKEPNKYLPSYGGWCGYAVAEREERMPPNPEQWKIENGRLVLFFDNIITKLRGGLLNKWNEDPEGYKARADANWQKMTYVKE